MVHARPIGVMEMDDVGQIDDKIIAVPLNEPYYRDVKTIIDLPVSRMNELKHFYSTYKIQEGGHVEIKNFRELNDAYQTINRCLKLYKKSSKS
jgi:inorganic pyrophosphatase